MLVLNKIEKRYINFHLKDISLSVEKGDYFVLLGESGAGKSIILEIIAGLIKPNTGSVVLNGKDITDLKIQKRKIGLLFQDYAVFPHMKVKDNIAYSVKKHKSASDVDRVVKELATKVSIDHLLNRRPETLSGGELQRVALARTLAFEPELLLLDEPLSSLDIHLRDELRSLLRKLNKDGISIIHVTHDYEEAISLATKVGIINDGRIIQTGTPKEVFHNPQSKFVAHLTGVKNFYNAEIIHENKVLLEGKTEITILPTTKRGKACLYFRAEDVVLSLSKLESSIANQLNGIIADIIPSTNGMEIVVDVGIKVIVLISNQSCEAMSLDIGKQIWIGIKASALKIRY